MSEIWYLWQDSSHSPAMNMALDEALMLTSSLRGKPLLRLYEWDREAVSIGYVQKLAKVPADRGEIVRRPTGGGIVYHKHHFTYTAVLPNSHWIVKDTRPVESYAWLNKCVQASLKLLKVNSNLFASEIPKSVDRAGMVCFVTPTKYDLLAEDKKIAGSAQRRAREGMLHQGSIEMENIDQFDTQRMRQVLPQGFAEVIKCQFVEYSPPENLLQLADRLVKEKYGTDEWNAKR